MAKKDSKVAVGRRKSRASRSAAPEKGNAAATSRQTKSRNRTKQHTQVARVGKGTAKKDKPGTVIRDSFTMPAADYELLGVLKTRCVGLGVAIKKSELLRAGLAALQQLSNESLATMVTAVESVKTGRPPGKKKRKKKKKKEKAEVKGRKR